MIINEKKRKKIRKALARLCAGRLCAMITMICLGVVTGVLIAPKSGKRTLADLKRIATKSMAAIRKQF